MALIEALVALLIMAFGMVALVGLQGTMRRASDLSKQRSEAMRIAQSELERLRDFSVATIDESSAAGTRDFASIQSLNACTGTEGEDACLQSINLGNASYSINRTVGDWSEAGLAGHTQTLPAMRSVQVRVNWVDRAAGAQFVQLDSFISKAETFLSGSLYTAPSAGALRRPGEREASIPLEAKDLGDHTSVFKPMPNGTVAWIFNNMTGVISSKCTVPATSPTANLTTADLQNCTTINGLLLSGRIWFSSTSTGNPNPRSLEGPALPVTLELSPIQPTPPASPGYDCFTNAPDINQSVSYYCVVYPLSGTPTVWSSGVSSTPSLNESPNIAFNPSNGQRTCPTNRSPGLKVIINDSTARWNVCRYSADYDGDGKLSNGEHPRSYINVSKALTNQNFLVVPAQFNAQQNPINSCPTGDPVNASAGIFSNYSTVWHQPARFSSQQSQNNGLETNVDNHEIQGQACSLAQ